MTRMLSELLGAEEPAFRLNIRELEAANGLPSHDVRLSARIIQKVQAKIRELGLDPSNTTGEELYEALRQRLLADESRLRDSLGLSEDSSPVDCLSVVERFFNKLKVPEGCFALKHSAAKRLFKNLPPAKAMKCLGYRSLDSMLKHEPVAQIYAAAFLTESSHWQKNFLDQYRQLVPGDFETRRIITYLPKNSRWQSLVNSLDVDGPSALVHFKELGEIVILPVNSSSPALAITNLLMLLESVNDVRCTSTYLKMQQVKPEFGEILRTVAGGQTEIALNFSHHSLGWRIIQHCLNQSKSDYIEALGPHIQAEDLELAKAEQAIARELPALEFWRGSNYLALVEDGKPVSLNILDVAVSVAHKLSFTERVSDFVRDHIWRELMSGYVSQAQLEDVIHQLSGEGEPELVPEIVEENPVLEVEEARV